MSDLKVVVAPVGRVDFKEVEAAVARVSKVLGAPVELREAAPLTRAAEDSTRGQYRSGTLLAELRRGLPRLSVVKVGETEGGAATAKPDVVLFITDVDLFTPQTDSVLGDLDPANKAALVSTRRLLEGRSCGSWVCCAGSPSVATRGAPCRARGRWRTSTARRNATARRAGATCPPVRSAFDPRVM
jgi:predicted Zn-dependent protease